MAKLLVARPIDSLRSTSADHVHLLSSSSSSSSSSSWSGMSVLPSPTPVQMRELKFLPSVSPYSFLTSSSPSHSLSSSSLSLHSPADNWATKTTFASFSPFSSNSINPFCLTSPSFSLSSSSSASLTAGIHKGCTIASSSSSSSSSSLTKKDVLPPTHSPVTTKRQRGEDRGLERKEEEELDPRHRLIPPPINLEKLITLPTRTHTTSSKSKESASGTTEASSGYLLIAGTRKRGRENTSSSGRPKERKICEPVFTLTQVKTIVQEAIAKRDTQLTAVFEAKLDDLLREQFRSFSDFNQEYLSHQFKLKGQDCSYID